jgi:cytidyltransferase-like protein
LLHIGHIRHFEQAKKLGDILVVTLTPDEHVNKGPNRPAFKQELRAEAIAALDCVDYVAINQWPLAAETIKMLSPDYYVKGQDYKDSDQDRTGGILLEEAAVKSVGGQIAFTDDIVFSSTNLLNEHMPVLNGASNEYLNSFTSRYSVGDVVNFLDGASGLKVLVIGETIIDEYVYCDALGKSGKEPVLVSRQVDTERFAGGVIAVANHISA